jgi:hypothetical protein
MNKDSSDPEQQVTKRDSISSNTNSNLTHSSASSLNRSILSFKTDTADNLVLAERIRDKIKGNQKISKIP